VILAYSKAFHKKPIPENRMQDRLWNRCLHFITKEVWPLYTPKSKPLYCYVWENVRGLSQFVQNRRCRRTQGNTSNALSCHDVTWREEPSGIRA